MFLSKEYETYTSLIKSMFLCIVHKVPYYFLWDIISELLFYV